MPDEIDGLAAEYWDFLAELHPTGAHIRGDYRFADRFEDYSRTAEDTAIARYRAFAAKARAIDEEGLTESERITREVLVFDAETSADFAETRIAEFGVNPIMGLAASLPTIVPQFTVSTPELAEAMVDKFQGIAGAFDALGQRHREGLATKRTPAEFAVTKTLAQLADWLSTPVNEDPLLNVNVPEGFDEAAAAAWRERLSSAVSAEVRPAMSRYHNLIRDEIAPSARPNDQAGLTWLHDGEETYARAIHSFTTLPMQAGEIHEIGLDQVSRLTDEYRELGPEAIGASDPSEIFSRLREDPSLHHTQGADIVAASEAAFAKARAAMGDWFGRLPKADCVVAETHYGPIAFYFAPARDGTRPGTFFMNTTDPTSWARYEIESTSFHEGIPGHHLQIAIGQELEDVPEFRRHAGFAAFAEGWGLYSERLSNEMGLYTTPLDRMGMVSADSMRACRLVVDTGLHALGWSHQEAIAYMVDNSPMSLHAIENEVDRYATYGGQALAYMIGRLEIQRMRSAAAGTLGDRFDISAFHDTVLGNGMIPLETLDRVVSEWIHSQQAV